MPRGRNDIPTYRRHRASGQAVVTLNGVDHYLGKWNSPESRAEYDRIIAEWVARGRKLGSGDPTLIKEVIAGYHSYCRGAKSPGELEKVEEALRPLRRLFGDLPCEKFTASSYAALRREFADHKSKGRRDDRLCISTIRMRLGQIKRCLAWGVAHGMVPDSVLARIGALEKAEPLAEAIPGLKRSKKVLPVPDGDLEAAIAHASPTIATMLRLQALTGMRPGEVCRISTGQLDRSGDVWIYTPTDHKTKHRDKDRAIPIGPKGQDLLRGWLRADPDQPMFSPEKARRDSDASRPHGEKRTDKERERRLRHRRRQRGGKNRMHFQPTYTAHSYGTAVARACERAGVTPFAVNRVRHTAGTAFRRDFGLEAAQVILGHAQANMTEVYAEKNLALAIDVARKIG
jgi:integrase